MTSDKVLREILFSLLEICERQEVAIQRLESHSTFPHRSRLAKEQEERSGKLGDIRIELCIEEGIANIGDCE